jgi:hypothetical protein
MISLELTRILIYANYPDWSLEFIRMACGKRWMLRSMERGNAPPRGSVLRDSTMVAKLGWPRVAAEAIETGFPTPAYPVWDALEISLRSALFEALLGQKSPKCLNLNRIDCIISFLDCVWSG